MPASGWTHASLFSPCSFRSLFPGTPALTTRAVLAEIMQLLEFPNPDNPLRADIAKLFKEDKVQHDKNAAEYTRKYAQ